MPLTNQKKEGAVMGPQNSRAKQLRQLMEEDKIIIAPGCYDALTAKNLQAAGCKAIYVTGYGLSASTLASPDLGLVTISEIEMHARNICNAVFLPVIVDADTGYGSPINVQRTVKQIEQTGAAGIQLEDQEWPKKCGHMEGKRVIKKSAMVQKIKAAIDARMDPDFVVIARSDARAVAGMDEAIDRINRYLEAGADFGFIDAPQSVEELKRQALEAKGPLVANMIEGGKTPNLSPQELEKMGYKLVIFPLSLIYAGAYSMLECAKTLIDKGTTEALQNRMIRFNEFNDLVGLKHFQKTEKKYSTD
jgi:carboxyvinyl-carboxyphosphonate phosphorylmutase